MTLIGIILITVFCLVLVALVCLSICCVKLLKHAQSLRQAQSCQPQIYLRLEYEYFYLKIGSFQRNILEGSLDYRREFEQAMVELGQQGFLLIQAFGKEGELYGIFIKEEQIIGRYEQDSDCS